MAATRLATPKQLAWEEGIQKLFVFQRYLGAGGLKNISFVKFGNLTLSRGDLRKKLETIYKYLVEVRDFLRLRGGRWMPK